MFKKPREPKIGEVGVEPHVKNGITWIDISVEDTLSHS
jgi:hypothetical protein